MQEGFVLSLFERDGKWVSKLGLDNKEQGPRGMHCRRVHTRKICAQLWDEFHLLIMGIM
jgi:hypothetical protein